MRVGFKTDKGIKRTNNEDAFFIMKEEGIFMVADGVGGNKAGEVASHMAVKHIAEFIEALPPVNLKDDEDKEDYFSECILGANLKIRLSSEQYNQNYGMATTLVVCYLDGKNMFVVNIGDSRCYLLRNKKLIQITEDHTYVNQLLKEGHITPEEAKHNGKSNVITRALGAEESVEPDFFSLETQKGDRVLLCTDGLYGEIEDKQIKTILDKNAPMTKIAEELIDVANENGGHDNITVACIEITEEDIDE